MEKWTAQEIASDKYLIKRVEEYMIRKCSYCGCYVEVYDYSGEHKTKDGTLFDICDECTEKYENDEKIEEIEPDYYEDYLKDTEELD